MSFTSVPVVNVSKLFSDNIEDRRSVAAELGDAARKVGFVYISGHGVSPEIQDGIRQAARDFFALPEDERMRYHIGKSMPGHKGYVPVNEEYFGVEGRDYKESFDVGAEVPEDNPLVKAGTPLLGHNQWPDKLPDFKKRVTEYYDAVFGLGMRLFRGFALALGMSENELDSLVTTPPSNLRLLHYWPNNGSAALGIGEHTDYECFTILLADEPGLEVMNGNGDWIDVPPVPGAFVVNIGDLLEVMTAGEFVATTHRVRPVTSERFSFPLFWVVDYGTQVKPLPQFAEKARKRPELYKEVCVGDHVWGQIMLSHRYSLGMLERGEAKLPPGTPHQGSYGYLASKESS